MKWCGPPESGRSTNRSPQAYRRSRQQALPAIARRQRLLRPGRARNNPIHSTVATPASTPLCRDPSIPTNDVLHPSFSSVLVVWFSPTISQ